MEQLQVKYENALAKLRKLESQIPPFAPAEVDAARWELSKAWHELKKAKKAMAEATPVYRTVTL